MVSLLNKYIFCSSDSLRLFLKNLCINKTNYLCNTECSVAPPLTVESKDARYMTRGNFTCLNNQQLLLYGTPLNEETTSDTLCKTDATWSNSSKFSCLTG